jgi:hypothetical protein
VGAGKGFSAFIIFAEKNTELRHTLRGDQWILAVEFGVTFTSIAIADTYIVNTLAILKMNVK